MTVEQTTRFRVEGMDCASCATKLDAVVRRLPGIIDVRVSVTSRTMVVSHLDAADLDKLARKVAGIGYKATRLNSSSGISSAARGETHGPSCCGHNVAQSHGREHDRGHCDPEHSRHDHSHSAGNQASDSGLPVHDHGTAETPWWRTPKARLTLASSIALIVALCIGYVVPRFAFWGFLAAIVVGIVPIARRALMAALAGTPFSIETLMTIAAVGAVIIGATEEAATVVFLFLVGELLEGVAAGRARASIQGLTKLVPHVARIEREGRLQEVAAADLPVGAVVVVRPGDRVPADGQIIDGESTINEAPVTGESVPKRKGIGETVFAGTVNGDGLIRVKVTVTASENTIARVVRLVEEAQETKAPTERFINQFSRYYTPGVVGVAALVTVLPPLIAGAAWSVWIYRGLAILLIGCPCALVISTPAAIAAGLSVGARRGLLMKGGAVLETVGRITAIALDKTGTLTEGKPSVTDAAAFGDVTVDEVLRLAAALETGSSHPMALAILAEATRRLVDVPTIADACAVAGKGVQGTVDGARLFLGSARAAAEHTTTSPELEARIAVLSKEGKSVSVLVKDRTVVGLVAMRDEPRADASQGLEALKAAGVKPIMLTGDNCGTAEAIGALLDIESRAELLPEDKQTIVRELQANGERVAKVGDGINDAPALAAAHVGIAMGGGTDVALETADAAVLHGRVTDIAEMVKLSRVVMSNIRQNISIAVGLKVVFLVTTVAGLTGLWPAILADTGATVLVTANAMRLLNWQGTGKIA